MLFDGLYYDVDFFEMVFKIVGFMGFKKGVVEVNLVLFEFIMKVEVIILEDWMGDVVGDINCCCGMIEGMEDGVVGVKIICVKVLFLEMFGYVIDLCL